MFSQEGRDAAMSRHRRRSVLLDRSAERAALDQLLAGGRLGVSGALVLRGEAGIGKTALLDYALAQAGDCRIVQATGVEAESELAFAGLHQICAPVLDRLARLPAQQGRALSTAFGLSAGETPDLFMVGLGVLGLLAGFADEQPVVCVVDDAQWLDKASAKVLGFVARRLRSESLIMIFAVRGNLDTDDMPELKGLPVMTVSGLSDEDSRALLASTFHGRVDERVLDRIIAECHGNPLALTELPRGFTAAELSGGFGIFNHSALPRRIEESFRRQIRALPPDARTLLLVAAVEPLGDPVLVWGALTRMGVPAESHLAASWPAAEFVDFGFGVRFRHPLLRSAVYRAASETDRRKAHAALADTMEPSTDPDRRAWHRAQAATGPDEDVATELQTSAARAQTRGGFAAAGAFLERAAELTPDPTRRASRLLAAAQARHVGGAPDVALRLLALAEADHSSDLDRARADLLRADIAFTVDRGRETADLFLKAASRLEPLDVGLARSTYLDALRAAWYASDSGSSGTLGDVALAAAAAPDATEPARPSDLLLDGLAVRYTAGFAAAVPKMREALKAFQNSDLAKEGGLRWLWFASSIATDLCQDDAADALTGSYVRLARESGALADLPLALTTRILMHLFAGDLSEASVLIMELDDVADGTGIPVPSYMALLLAAWQGDEARTIELAAVSAADARRRGEGLAPAIVGWAQALLYNGVGRFGEALGAAQLTIQSSLEPGVLTGAPLVELIIAAARTGQSESGADALERLSISTQACGTDWALGMEACCRAMLTGNARAEDSYVEAIERLQRTRIRPLTARAHLYYGEWLWELGRRDDGRDQLRMAYDMFTTMGMEAFAASAAHRLGLTIRQRPSNDTGSLTPQETHIVKLAREGLSNAEIGTRLFISPRTVEWHLSKIFAKLGITSRRQLRR
ncbi:helix-turn-helix transcriptional regulator [Micromonospora sp. WMMC250]|uniref:helix-turn-helix transcriptional regulator n=1 Tax=Micromonospora sp. WMMC250 TaxID=3014781 RepID=UPI0022B697D9|nr:LuxR family transcriptional regulator [Micromonospora sp. WMMC250]MCZ7373350.1 LuxR C-terminal-related transcriptional regulator [Micromonospora sp. WMMC250]